MPERTIKLNVIGDNTSASKVLDEVAAKSEGTADRAKKAFSTMWSTLGASGVLGPFQEQISQVSQIIDRVSSEGSKKLGTMFMAGGGGTLAAGGVLTKMASQDVEAGAQLRAAIEATGATYDDYADRIGSVSKAQLDFAHDDADAVDAIRILTQETGDANKAMDDMQLVSDLAAAKNVGLADAATMVAKAHGGATRLFKEFGIEIRTNADGSKDMDAALAQLSGKLQGQAAASVEGFSGHLRVLKAHLVDGLETLGEKYGPALMGVGATMTAVGGIMETGGAIINRFRGAQEAATVATEGMTVATEAQTAAYDAEAVSEGIALGPILLIIAAVAVLAIGIYELYTHWDTVWSGIQAITGVVVGFIQGLIGGAINWIQNNWDILAAILFGPFGIAADAIYRNWDAIVGFIQGMPGRIAGAASGMWHGITDEFKSAINAVIGVWDNFRFPSVEIGLPKIHIWGTDTDIGGGSFTIGGWAMPQIPYMAEGGITVGPTLLAAGDNRSGREAIVPLERAQEMGFTGGGEPITLELHLELDGRTLTRVVRTNLLRDSGRNVVTVGLS